MGSKVSDLLMIAHFGKTNNPKTKDLLGDIKDQESVPVFQHMKDANEGPFLELMRERFTNLPKKSVLTKTHCGGVSLFG